MVLRDEKLKFDESEHKYTYEGQELISVTNFIDLFKEEFDEDAQAEKKALKTGKGKQEILDDWKEAREFGQDFGTRIHEYADKCARGLKPKDWLDVFSNEKEVRDVVDKYFEDHKRLRYVASELPLVSPLHKLAGTADMVLTDGEGKFFLYDWKTSREIVQDNRYKKFMKEPLYYLPDTNFWHYSLQLSFYRYLLEKKGLYITNSYIVHLGKDGYKEYKVPYLKDEVEALLLLRLLGVFDKETVKE